MPWQPAGPMSRKRDVVMSIIIVASPIAFFALVYLIMRTASWLLG